MGDYVKPLLPQKPGEELRPIPEVFPVVADVPA